MEVLCEQYPVESISFFKRAIQMTIMTGLAIVGPTTYLVYLTWQSTERSLRWWSIIRVLVFLIQLPVRYRIWKYVMKAQDGRFGSEIAVRLGAIFRSKEWKFTQYLGAFVTTWAVVTLILTFCIGTEYPKEFESNYEGYLAPSLFRLCWISVVIVCIQLTFVISWLKKIFANDGQNLSVSESPLLTERQINKVTIIIGFDPSNPFHKKNLENCAICLESYKANESIRVINFCSHDFHKKCIDDWLMCKARCPLCNHLISVAEVCSSPAFLSNNPPLDVMDDDSKSEEAMSRFMLESPITISDSEDESDSTVGNRTRTQFEWPSDIREQRDVRPSRNRSSSISIRRQSNCGIRRRRPHAPFSSFSSIWEYLSL